MNRLIFGFVFILLIGFGMAANSEPSACCERTNDGAWCVNDVESACDDGYLSAPTSIGGSRFTRFNVKLNSPVYEMVMIATSILQFESRYGDSDVSTIAFLYPDYFVEKLKMGDGTTIYSLEHKTMGNEFRFASKSLVWPAGYDLEGEQ